jgi:hypothetical protein
MCLQILLHPFSKQAASSSIRVRQNYFQDIDYSTETGLNYPALGNSTVVPGQQYTVAPPDYSNVVRQIPGRLLPEFAELFI